VKVITSLKAELNETCGMEEECENRLEQSKGEACKWKEEVREQKAEVGRLTVVYKGSTQILITLWVG
jgi:hypothetical protein